MKKCSIGDKSVHKAALEVPSFMHSLEVELLSSFIHSEFILSTFGLKCIAPNPVGRPKFFSDFKEHLFATMIRHLQLFNFPWSKNEFMSRCAEVAK